MVKDPTIHLGFAEVRLIEGWLVRCEFLHEFEYTLEHTFKMEEEISNLIQGRRLPHLIIMCPDMTIEKEVRDYGVTEAAIRNTLANAIVCNSLSHRILGNFFIKVQRPRVPTRMFSAEDVATRWLSEKINLSLIP